MHMHQRKNACKICGKVFASVTYMNKHFSLFHEGEKNFQCPFCGKSFGRSSHLKIHEEEQHGDVARQFSCNICNQSFKRKHALEKHKIVHTERTATIVCIICQKTFLSELNLKNHTKIHTGEKPFNCALCLTVSFRTASDLKSHMRVHTDDDYRWAFPCQQCGKKFTTKSSLKVNARLHGGEKPHKCEICKKLFNQIGHMKDHMKKVHGSKT